MATQETKLAEATDLVVLENNQVLTTSLKVAEVFGKKHKNVMQTIENSINSLREVSGLNFQPTEKGFIPAVYLDTQGKERPMYYLNRDAFSFVVMGFTGKKAAEWKWRYIQAFNQLEEQLKNSVKSLSPLEILEQQVQIMKNQQLQLDQNTEDIKDIRRCHSINLFHQHKINKDTQNKLLQHEQDISGIKQVLNGSISPCEEIKSIVDLAVKNYQLDYKEAYHIIYDQIEKSCKINLNDRLTRLKKRLQDNGATKTKIDNVTKLDVIEQDPTVWKLIFDVLAALRQYVETI